MIKAHFDGRVIVPHEAINVPVNTPVRVLIPDGSEDIELTAAFTKLSESSFKRVWDNEEDAAYDKL